MQDNYTQCERKAASLIPFKGNTMRGEWDERDNGTYLVYSYRTVIAKRDTLTGYTWYNDAKYSRTTSRHQGVVRRAWGIA